MLDLHCNACKICIFILPDMKSTYTLTIKEDDKYTRNVYAFVTNSQLWFNGFITRGQYWPPGIVVACVCPSVPPPVRHQVCPRDNSSPVQARITKFRP